MAEETCFAKGLFLNVLINILWVIVELRITNPETSKSMIYSLTDIISKFLAFLRQGLRFELFIWMGINTRSAASGSIVLFFFVSCKNQVQGAEQAEKMLDVESGCNDFGVRPSGSWKQNEVTAILLS